jgi:hypothetical protein
MLFRKIQADYSWVCLMYVTRVCGRITEFLKVRARHTYMINETKKLYIFCSPADAQLNCRKKILKFTLI